MTTRTRRIKLFAVVLLLLLAIFVIGATITFARYYDDYEKKTDSIKIADAVARIEVNSVYRTECRIDGQTTKISIPFDKNADTLTLYDVEPEDEIEYYFTVTSVDGKRQNEVNLNVVLSVSVRLETINANGKNSVDYFAGWTNYTTGIRDGGLLQIYHGAENGSETQIQPSAQQQDDKIDYTGNSLLVVTDSDSKITNKTGLVMAADSTTKDYHYHIRFKVPRQNSDKDNYAGARLYFDVQVVGEQTQN